VRCRRGVVFIKTCADIVYRSFFLLIVVLFGAVSAVLDPKIFIFYSNVFYLMKNQSTIIDEELSIDNI
jgi:hypothetical protein